MDRRRFIDVAWALVAAPLATMAQPATKGRRIGVLTAGTTSALPPSLFEGLRGLGWIEGQNLVIERRGAEGKAELAPLSQNNSCRSKSRLS